jgi:hypothetical protein
MHPGYLLKILRWCILVVSSKSFQDVSKIIPREVSRMQTGSFLEILHTCFRDASVRCFKVTSKMIKLADTS